MASRFDRRAHRDPRLGLRAERTKLLNEDIVEASEVMHEARTQATYLVESAQREAEELLEAARATGRGLISQAERDAEAIREGAALDRELARDLLNNAKATVAKARKSAEAASRAALPTPLAADPDQGFALEPKAEPIELNEASMVDLRAAGLSITQARRVIGRRDDSGPYASVEELAELPGMPAELVARIKPHLRV